MKIKFIKGPSGVGYAYFVGDEVVMSNNVAKELIEDGFAIQLTDDMQESDLPVDMPGRDVFIKNGITKYAEIKKIKDLQKIDGVGKTVLKEAQAYIAGEKLTDKSEKIKQAKKTTKK